MLAAITPFSPESLKGLGFLGSVYTDEGCMEESERKVATIKRDE